jgi:hypothetical protein
MYQSVDHHEARIHQSSDEEAKLFLHRIRKLAPYSYSNLRYLDMASEKFLAPRWDCQKPHLVCMMEIGHYGEYGEV